MRDDGVPSELETAQVAPARAFLAGGGKLADIIAAFDWSKTPLGPIETWPTSIKTTVGLILRSPIPIVTLWGELGIMIYNDAYSGFAGGRHPRLLGSEVRKGWPEVADFNDNVMKVGLSGGTLSYRDQELTLFRSGAAEQVSMNLDYSPVIGEGGEPIGVIAIVVETSAKVQAERELREEIQQRQVAQERQRRLFEQAPAFIIIMRGPNHIVEFVNKQHREIFNSGDWPGRTIRNAFPSLEGQGFFEILDTVYRTGETFKTDAAPVSFRTSPDSPALMHYLTFIYAPLYDDAGAISGIFCEGFDVTEAVLAEQRFREELEAKVAERTAEVQQNEKTIRTIFETSYMNQGLLTTDGKIVYVNATSLASIKSRFEDVVGKNFWETPWFTGTPGMPEKVREGIERVAAGESIQIAMPLNMPTGNRIYEFSMRPAIDESGKVFALVPEAVEITARVRAEQALLQAQKVEVIGNLTGGIAHDFNNLLMAVLGSLELLRKRVTNDDALLRLIDTATEGARRGRSLTARMLAFARRQDLKPERIDIEDLVRGMVELMQRSLGPTITIDIKIDRPLPRVQIDPNQLEAALLNLAVNARDAMHGEGPIVIAASECAAAPESGLRPGQYVCLTVTDAGEGMDEETLRRATEPFFTTKGLGKGTGLGLSMVHGLAEQSGGMLLLRSTPGVGTAAELWLPAVEQTTHAAADDAAPRAVLDATNARGRLSVLVVDDDPLVLMSTVDMLEDLGHEVVAAGSGEQALDRLARARFDLMLTDHAMPRMTGAQLIAEAQARHPGLPVVLATGYADLPPGGASDVLRLSKPFTQADLAAILSQAVRTAPRA